MSVTRNNIKFDFIETAQAEIVEKMQYRLATKGHTTYASSHEALGIITEEYFELIEAVKSDDINEVKRELIDVAVGCLFAVACIDADEVT